MLDSIEKARQTQESFSSFNPAFAIIIGVALFIVLITGWLTILAINRVLKSDKKQKNNVKKTEKKPIPKPISPPSRIHKNFDSIIKKSKN